MVPVQDSAWLDISLNVSVPGLLFSPLLASATCSLLISFSFKSGYKSCYSETIHVKYIETFFTLKYPCSGKNYGFSPRKKDLSRGKPITEAQAEPKRFPLITAAPGESPIFRAIRKPALKASPAQVVSRTSTGTGGQCTMQLSFPNLR
jgi:hypothetical protein